MNNLVGVINISIPKLDSMLVEFPRSFLMSFQGRSCFPFFAKELVNTRLLGVKRNEDRKNPFGHYLAIIVINHFHTIN